jgi:hypothetical protein
VSGCESSGVVGLTWRGVVDANERQSASSDGSALVMSVLYTGEGIACLISGDLVVGGGVGSG